jgi:hypothetical protein
MTAAESGQKQRLVFIFKDLSTGIANRSKNGIDHWV